MAALSSSSDLDRAVTPASDKCATLSCTSEFTHKYLDDSKLVLVLESESGPPSSADTTVKYAKRTYFVSAEALRLCSPYLRQKLDEQLPMYDDTRYALTLNPSASEQAALTAWKILLDLIHLQNHNVPETLGFNVLFHILKLTHRFDCVHVLRGFARQWLAPLKDYIRFIVASRFSEGALFVAWELGDRGFCEELLLTYALNTDYLDVCDSLSREAESSQEEKTGLQHLFGLAKASFKPIQQTYETLVNSVLTDAGDYCQHEDPAEKKSCSTWLSGLVVCALVHSPLPFPQIEDLWSRMSITEATEALTSLGMEPWEGSREPSFHRACHPAVKIAAALEEAEGKWEPIFGEEHLARLREQAKKSGM